MKTTLHKANTRGHANHGWLDSYFTFSFSEYYHPERIHFGKLRVINDDTIAPSMGFGLHPHENMEIISIPLEGALKHTDNTGNEEIIKKDEIQVMTAGTGIWHSEYNASDKEDAKLLQIWIFPEKNGLKPYYETKAFDFDNIKNSVLLLAGHPSIPGEHLKINQQAFISYGKLDSGQKLSYTFYNKNNGIYIFVIFGSVDIQGTIIGKRDGLGIENVNQIAFESKEDSKFVLFEVPMN
ncbi:MAG: pirin family protein [Salinivirgaceae bacterium]|nr:pirin family protein [Salinivirgaceae bacterium]